MKLYSLIMESEKVKKNWYLNEISIFRVSIDDEAMNLKNEEN